MGKIQNIKIAQLETNNGQIEGLPKNPRFIKDNRFKQLVKSIEDAPEMLDYRTLLVFPHEKKYVIIAGNMRFRACKEIGYKELPCYVLPEETPAEKLREYAIKDNIGFGSDDWDLLANEWNEDELKDWGVELPADWGGNEEETEIEEDEIPEEVETRCKRGDVWILGEHRLMCGDSTDSGDVTLLMNGEKADLLFTDPPYNVNIEQKKKKILHCNEYNKIENDNLPLDTFKEFLGSVFSNACQSLKESSSYYVFSCQGGDNEMMMMMMRESGIKCRHQIIWVKDAPVFSMGRLDYDYKHEPILYGWKKKHKFYRKGSQDKSVWEFKRTENKIHPTMKPVELIANALLNSTQENDFVLDMFGGSGSTLIACEQLKRKCFMMELDEHYCDVILARWEKLTGKTAELLTNVNKPKA